MKKIFLFLALLISGGQAFTQNDTTQVVVVDSFPTEEGAVKEAFKAITGHECYGFGQVQTDSTFVAVGRETVAITNFHSIRVIAVDVATGNELYQLLGGKFPAVVTQTAEINGGGGWNLITLGEGGPAIIYHSSQELLYEIFEYLKKK